MLKKWDTWEVDEAVNDLTLFMPSNQARALTTEWLACQLINDFITWNVATPHNQDYRAWEAEKLTDDDFAQRTDARNLELAEWVRKVMAWVKEQGGITRV